MAGGTLTDPVDPGRDDWHRTVPGWHLAFATLAVLTAGLLFTGDAGPPAADRPVALLVLVLLCGWYGATGARALHRTRSRVGVVYLAGAVPLSAALFAAAPSGALMSCMLYPHIWALLPLRRAIAVTVASVASMAAVMIVRSDAYGQEPPSVILVAAVALVAALVLGVWITRIIEQSRQRARLVEELAATRTELAEVSRQAGALAERERLAREIHDTLAQGFTSVLLLLEAAKAGTCERDQAARGHLDQARRTAVDNLAEARALVAALPPPQLFDASLPDALGGLIERFEAETAIEAAFMVTGTPRRLTPNEEVVLLRVTQEALANVRKHASGAGRLEGVLAYGSGGVTLRISDDGQGFDPGDAGTGFGIGGMRERVTEVGGSLSVGRARPSGTLVQVELPS
ncbi:sensor histidine kinase [Nonomuraea phyllanthi]|uniref:sensor histidine kinase n=1 Tax=Nonomuraea phyllanthi TaxID=2219224 RepID=UPI001292FB96|nr:sensor histidine kinase [Nonomuraea phyllanthi]QFY09384.1 sensor histidine kinase [Nonomuraea phyllanthi]